MARTPLFPSERRLLYLVASRMAIDLVDAIVAGDTPTKYGRVAALAMLIYDYSLTFGAEIEFVWARDWSLGKALFIFARLQNRYFGMAALLCYSIAFFYSSESLQRHHTSCQHFIWCELTTYVEPIHAVYISNRRLLVLMIVLLIAEVVSSLLLAVLEKPEIMLVRVNGMTDCQNNAPSPRSFVSWIPLIVFETFLMSLMLYQAWRIYRSDLRSKLLHLIIRDSAFYFLIMFMTLLANCIVWAIPGKLHVDPKIALGWAIAIPCTVGCRLLLNMRERYFTETTLFSTVG
ncbi:hypothetical protein JB92DRAFT_2924165 [Gautieria morchelliformis]|nr:hypothetical protein JB92DRAFT_2924165 [Gautieria morchelliformis]